MSAERLGHNYDEYMMRCTCVSVHIISTIMILYDIVIYTVKMRGAGTMGVYTERIYINTVKILEL